MFVSGIGNKRQIKAQNKQGGKMLRKRMRPSDGLMEEVVQEAF
jgi:hypothetical protein